MRIDNIIDDEAYDDYPALFIEITLSEKNLRSLLAKLEGHPKDSACTIVSDPITNGPIGNSRYAGPLCPTLIVHAEPDAIHYANRVPAGPMHPDTEEAIK